jgi:hypothetical protein
METICSSKVSATQPTPTRCQRAKLKQGTEFVHLAQMEAVRASGSRDYIFQTDFSMLENFELLILLSTSLIL